MMKRRIWLFLLIEALALPAGHSQQSTWADLLSFVNSFRNSSWKERMTGFYNVLRLAYPPDYRGYIEPHSALAKVLRSLPVREQEEVRAGVITLLLTEGTLVERNRKVFLAGGTGLSEEYVTYYGDLIEAVASLNDEAAIVPLLQAINTGDMATAALARYGDAVIDPALDRLRSDDITTKLGVLHLFGKMLSPGFKGTIGTESKKKVRDALVHAAGDENAMVRKGAVRDIGLLGDADLIPMVREIAVNDPYPGIPGAKADYPVRKEAKRALVALSADGKR